MWQAGQSPVPGYKLEKFLGKGNFGEVWQSTSPGGTKCALKFLNLRERQGRKELRAIQRLKQIRHANIMPINAMWLLDDQQQIIPDDQFEPSHPFMEDTSRQTLVSLPQIPEEEKPKTLVIAMPVAEGNLLELLNHRQKQGKNIPVEELLVYMMDAARALDYLNTQCHEYQGQIVSVQHGDVKPENLVLLGGSVMLCDFGVARILGSGRDTRGTTLGGSLAYMAPECLAGEISQHSDQFSLAISYAELRTGHLPFADESITQVIEDRRKGQLDLDGLTPAEQRIIRRACSLTPEKRFGSNVEFVEALRSSILETKPQRKAYHWLVPLTFLIAIASTGVLWWMFAPPKQNGAIEKTGRDYYEEAMELLRQPIVTASQLAEAKEKYALALDAEFPSDVPEPLSLGVPDNDSNPVYTPRDLRNSHLVAVHPTSGRILVVGRNGRTLIDPNNPRPTDPTFDLGLASPIISVRWLDDSQVLVCDSQLTLWRFDLTAPATFKNPAIASNVLLTVTSPQAGVGLAANDIEGGIIYRIDTKRVEQTSLRMTTPLLNMDEDGVWGVTLEEGEAPGTARLLSLNSTSSDQPLTIVGSVDTDLEPYCVACLRMEENGFVVVGGRGKSAQNLGGLAVIPFPDTKGESSTKTAEAIFPISPFDQTLSQDNGRHIRTLATHYSSEQKVGLLATGQNNGSVNNGSFTELWHINSDGTTISQGLVGQATTSPSISALAFDPSGKWLVRGTEYGEIRLTNLSQPKLDFWLLPDDYDAEVLQLQIVGGNLVATFDDASVLIWNFYECQMVFEMCLQKKRELPQPKFKRPHSG